LEEQEETEPLQAKELPGHNPEVSLNKEQRRQPEGTPDGMIQAKTLESGFTPSPLSIQRGIRDLVSNGLNKTGEVVSKGWNKGKEIVGAGLGKGRDLLTGGLDWVKNNIIQPLMRLGSSGWSAVKGFGNHIGNAYKQANPTIWDVFGPQHLLFRMARNQRRQLFAQAIQAERSQQARAAAGVQSSGPAPVREPSQLERLNELAEKIESVPAAGFNVGKELLEGAVVGDFKENPTIWNTIGQVAIGFVPYAGQAADIRDLVANVKKLHETGYKDPDAWINLVLTGIGFIPGVGDIIKAVGKGSKGAIRKALSGVLKNADHILGPALGKAKGLLNGARRYGKQFLGWASRQGARLRQGVTRFAQKTVNFAKAAGQRARGLVTALKARIGGFVNGAMQRARDVANQGRGLLGKVMGPFMGMATKAFDAVQSRVSQAVNMVKTAAQRGKDIALKVGRKVVDVTRKATTLLKEFTQSAIQKGRQAVQKARQWSSQQIKKATELGRRLVAQARKRVADLVRKGVKLAKEKAVTWIKQKIGGIKQRVLGFLKDRWNRLKEKLGIKKPGEAGKEGAKRGGKETTDNAAKKAKELPAALAQAKAITASSDEANIPVPALLRILSSRVKPKYSWIKGFDAEQTEAGKYSIALLASRYVFYVNYDHLRHTDPAAFAQLQNLGARQGNQIRAILEAAGPDQVMRSITDRAGRPILLMTGNRETGLLHTVRRHLIGDLPGKITTFFPHYFKVGDVIDVVAQTVRNGTRSLDQTTGNWVYRWIDPRCGKVMAIVDNAGYIVTAYPY
jgi:F0F1-type ATP synthase membrane subunit b/b'